MIYVPKKTRKVEVLEETLFFETEVFPKEIIVSVVISKTAKTSFLFVESNTKVNAKYYCNMLLKKMIPEMNRLAKYNEYLFAQT